MFDRLKEDWQQLRQTSPGERFESLYRSRKERDDGGGVVRSVIAALLLVVGVVMLVIPGPGLLVMALGFALLASQSLGLARRLDGLELRLRRWRRA